MLVRVCPTTPIRCNPLLLVLSPENPCQTWDPRAKIRLLYRIELKFRGSAVAFDFARGSQVWGGFSGLKTKSNWHFPLVGLRSRARTADPQTWRSIRLKYEIWPGIHKFEADSRGLKPKATGLHLVGVRGHTLTSTLTLLASWAEVLGSNGGSSNLAFYAIKIRNLARGSQV